jgi:hypothetical protein
MATSTDLLSERAINRRLSIYLQGSGLLVLRELRLNPYEFDIVALHPQTLTLMNIEVKRSNWREILRQTIRGRLHCHLAVAVLPLSMRQRVPLEPFIDCGIGLWFYSVSERSIEVTTAVEPQRNARPNRCLKRDMYRRFLKRFKRRVDV